MKNLVNAAGLIGQNRNPGVEGESSTKDITFPRPTLANSVAGLTNRSDQVFGIYARISAWGHEHTKSDAYSAAVIQVSNDQGAEYNAIRAGLHTLPSLYKDTKLHLRTGTGERAATTRTARGSCRSKTPTLGYPGMVVEALSSYNQTDSSMILQIVKDERPGIGGDWWLYRVAGPVRFPLGRWPASLFGSLSRHATEAAWYGAVGSARRGGAPPAMGSGHGPGEGYTRAAYFADISLMDRTAYPVYPSLGSVAAVASDERCYKVAMDAGGGNTFFYGGPVSRFCA
ncbi:hypothetical protein C2845_PM02G07970 [Panicum miliaceum]|uniref:Neprosin PEP catalytic domain-containing protein n=1 Tax=Panicum miliaceum TaxID=4540 RepID=A0A3L6SEQ1_PANMI|nr:hypothetical protein C2845_PM02G07970 [Panicum miliaceum]